MLSVYCNTMEMVCSNMVVHVLSLSLCVHVLYYFTVVCAIYIVVVHTHSETNALKVLVV